MQLIKTTDITSNTLKLLAAITMLIDHIGLILLNNYEPFRIIGRISFPIFAFLISEGCKYTKNKKRHFLEIFFLGTLCQIGYFLTTSTIYLGVLLTFSLSIPVIYLINLTKENVKYISPTLLSILLIWFICEGFSRFFLNLHYSFDYGFFGAMLPVIISIFDKKHTKIIATFIGTLLVAFSLGNIQYFSLLAIIPLTFYNGTHNRPKFKYGFYIFYPLHFVALYCISYII